MPANKATPEQNPEPFRETAEMSAEYKFDYNKAKPNRFADRMQSAPRFAEQIVVVLDPDVAKIFTSGEEVNQALRALISAMPKRQTATPKQEPGLFQGDGAGQGRAG
ncbi:MAG: hypothetical protein NT121_20655 [Chloroflexi bacterium]|nr:hypothetical protein [Chloroflexota bacterium]